MRRLQTALKPASAGAILGAVLSVGLTASVATAQQLFQAPATPPPAASDSASAKFDPMASARNARTSLRNGIDFIKYKDYTRALRFLREAERRQADLDPAERKALAMSIAHVQKKMEEGSVKPSPATLANATLPKRDNSAVQAGAMALASADPIPKAEDVQLTSNETPKLSLDKPSADAAKPAAEKAASIEVELPKATAAAAGPQAGPGLPRVEEMPAPSAPADAKAKPSAPAIDDAPTPIPAVPSVELPALSQTPSSSTPAPAPARPDSLPDAPKAKDATRPEPPPVIGLEPLPEPARLPAPEAPAAETKPAPTPAPAPEAKPADDLPALPEAKPVPAPAAETKPVDEAKPVIGLEPLPEAKPSPAPAPASKPADDLPALPEAKPVPAPAAEAKPADDLPALPEAKPTPAPAPEAKPADDLPALPEAKPVAAPAAKPVDEAKPVIGLEPLPEAKPSPAPAPASKPADDLPALPEAKPVPAPAAEAKPADDLPALPEARPAPEMTRTPAEEPKPAPEPETKPAAGLAPLPEPAQSPAPPPTQGPAPAPDPVPVPDASPASAPASSPASVPSEAPSALPPLPGEANSAPESVPAPAPAGAPAAPAAERPLPVTPIGTPTPPISPAVEPPPAAEAEAVAAKASEAPAPAPSAAPDVPGTVPGLGIPISNLPPDVQNELARVAARNPQDPKPTPPPVVPEDPALISERNMSQSRIGGFELPRPPSSTEARPLRRIPVPEEFVPYVKREWEPQKKFWAAPALCHMPLYFQDAALERYGHSVETYFGSRGRFLTYPLDKPTQSKQRNQILQPFFSYGLFMGQIITFPYRVVMDPPWEAEYDLGYYRPGDRMPRSTIYLPLTGVGPPLHGKNY